MSRERKAGLIFGLIILLLLTLIVIILVASAQRGVRVSATFTDAQGLVVGDRVILNGVPIGEVTAIEFAEDAETPNRIRVRFVIDRDYRERVQHNAVAFITNRTFPNVSGQKFVEIYNPPEPAEPIEDGAEIRGVSSQIELKSWQLQSKIEEWAEEAQSTAKALAETARQTYERAREGLLGPAEPGEPPLPGEAPDPEPLPADRTNLADVRPTPTPQATPTPTPTPLATPPGSPQGAQAPPVAPPDDEQIAAPAAPAPATADDPATSPERLQGLQEAYQILSEFAQSEDYRVLADRMIYLLSRLNTVGPPYVIYEIVRDWENLKAELQPALHALREAGRAVLHDELEAIMFEIEEQIRLLLETMKSQPQPATDDSATTLVVI